MRHDFPVLKRTICHVDDETRQSSEIIGKSALVNGDTNQVLSIVSDRYEITTHQEVIDTFDQINGIQREEIKLSENGGIMFANYTLPAGTQDTHEVTIGDTVRFGLRVFNSYNLLTSRGCELIAYRLVCNNGMVLPKKAATISFRHMNNQGMERIGSRIGSFTHDIGDIVNTWRNWTNRRPEEGIIRGFVRSMQLGTEELEENITNQMLEATNLWDIYNVMTYYTTHEMVNRGINKIANQRKKSYDYTNLFYTYEWFAA